MSASELSETDSSCSYTSAHKRRRRLEDAVFAIAESCKNDNNASIVSLIQIMQQQQQQFQALLLETTQQQQQFQAQRQQQQQQFLIDLMSKFSNVKQQQNNGPQ